MATRTHPNELWDDVMDGAPGSNPQIVLPDARNLDAASIQAPARARLDRTAVARFVPPERRAVLVFTLDSDDGLVSARMSGEVLGMVEVGGAAVRVGYGHLEL